MTSELPFEFDSPKEYLEQWMRYVTVTVTRLYKDKPKMHFEFVNHLSCILASGVYVDNNRRGQSFEFGTMELPVKMRDLLSLRPIQFIDEGYSEMYVIALLVLKASAYIA